jgi:hypothetical protein
MTRPGIILRAFAQRVCSGTAMERVVDPALADLQREHVEAIRGDSTRQAVLVITLLEVHQ